MVQQPAEASLCQPFIRRGCNTARRITGTAFLMVALCVVVCRNEGVWAQAKTAPATQTSTGLKDVAGSETANGPDGSLYSLTTGEDVESGDLGAGRTVIVSAAPVLSMSPTVIVLKFADGSTRSWTIVGRTVTCDESGKRIPNSQIRAGEIVTVRWLISNQEVLKSPQRHDALSVKRGHMRYKVGEPGGRVVLMPRLANNGCGS
jgi:hypothetical protein